MKLKQIFSIIFVVSLLVTIIPSKVFAFEMKRSIVFPVLGGATYRNDFGEYRVGGRTHEGNDLMAEKMRPLLAAVDGEISFITQDEATWGWSLSILDDDGYEYNYLHINNDTPGTDDGLGGYNNAFAQGIKLGVKVKQGEVVAYLGDSGNAETTAPHLHFEIRDAATQTPINPYESLQAAKILSTPVAGSKKSTKTTKVKASKDLTPFGSFTGGANLSSGNFDKDTDLELVTTSGFNSGDNEVVILNSDGKEIKSFVAFDKSFKGGADVATADIDGDGKSEVIVSSGPGMEATVKIFKSNGDLISSFIPYPKFFGGVHVSASDINGDGQIEIVTSPSEGGGPHVKVYSAQGSVLKEFMAYSPNFHGGVDVSSFAPSGSYVGGIVTSPGPGGGPHVKVYNFDLKVVGEFMAFPQSFSGGVRVEGGNFVQNNGSFEVVTVPASNSSASTKIFKINGELLKTSNASFEDTWTGGFDVTMAGAEAFITSSGGRKTTIKKITF